MTEPGVASSDPTQLQSTGIFSYSSSSSSSRQSAARVNETMPSFERIMFGLPLVTNKDNLSAEDGDRTGTTDVETELRKDEDKEESDRKDKLESQWILNGRKWWTTGACDPRCACCIFVALTGSKSDPPHRRHSLFIFPLNSPGVSVVRPLYVMGYDDAPHGHAEVLFEDVSVRVSDILGGLGMGFEVAQSRLGPGRLHHCSRLVGHGERAIQEILNRGSTRKAFGKNLLDLGGNSEKLANCRIVLRLAKLSLLEAAVELDKAASTHAVRLPDSALQALAVTKVATPKAVQECLDFAIQIHGGGELLLLQIYNICCTAKHIISIIQIFLFTTK